jgi:GNAT superfamily N-acetyltransferase
MIIREANANDAASIARVNVDTWKTTYAGIMPQALIDSRTYEQRTTHWQNILLPRWQVYVAEDDGGNVVGFAGGGDENGELQGFTGELGFIYLLKSYQRQGIGRKLAATVALKLNQLGHNSMFVWVLTQNPYKAFYETLGGHPIAEREVNFGGVNLREIAYGWRDLGIFEKILKSGPNIKYIN